MSLVQTDRAPDLIIIEEREITEPDFGQAATKELVARIGSAVAKITKTGRRATDPLTEFTISRTDLAALCKEAYRLGWSGKCKHVDGLFSAMTKEIGQ